MPGVLGKGVGWLTRALIVAGTVALETATSMVFVFPANPTNGFLTYEVGNLHFAHAALPSNIYIFDITIELSQQGFP